METADPADSPPEVILHCQLLGSTALIVQGLMGIFVISSLVIKRQLEKRKRAWRIWLWDVGKQLVGQAVIHALNLLISDQIALAGDANPCSLYFLNVLIDTTIGVGIFFLALKTSTWYFVSHLGYEGFVSGLYGEPPRPKFWWNQLVPYLISIVVMKTLVLISLTFPLVSSPLLRFGHALLDYLPLSVQVIFVMAIFPLIMNVIQFCVVDQVIKANKPDRQDTADEEQGYSRLPMSDDIRLSQGETPSHRNKHGSSQTGSAPASPAYVQSPLLSPRYDTPRLRRYGSTSGSPSYENGNGLGNASGTGSGASWLQPNRKTISHLSLQSLSGTEAEWSIYERDRDRRRSDAPSPDSAIVPLAEDKDREDSDSKEHV